jgi:subtilisin family serine protease
VSVQSLDFKEVKEFAGEPGVAAIAPLMATYLIRPLSDVELAAAGDAWGIAAVGADRSNWTGEGVTVAILDTGIDRQHPAFAGVDIVEKDFTGSGDGDRQGHGTHCAGTVFGRDVDGKRIGIARGVNRALIGKVLGDQGGGNSNMIFEGIQWAIQQGAQVISMSLGFDFPVR